MPLLERQGNWVLGLKDLVRALLLDRSFGLEFVLLVQAYVLAEFDAHVRPDITLFYEVLLLRLESVRNCL